jgi:hypothetical protein
MVVGVATSLYRAFRRVFPERDRAALRANADARQAGTFPMSRQTGPGSPVQSVVRMVSRGYHGRAMKVEVESYAGYRGDQEPCAIHLESRRREVEEIVERWVEPGTRWFKCLVQDGTVYTLRYVEDADEWELISLARAQPLDR